MSKKSPPQLMWGTGSCTWIVFAAHDAGQVEFSDYDSALAEFERQVELYRAPEPKRRRWVAWLRSRSWDHSWETRYLPEGVGGQDGWVRAPWLDEPDDEGAA